MVPDESQPITATIGGALDDYRLPLIRLGRPRKYLRPGETWDSLPPPRPKLMNHPRMPGPRVWAWEAARDKWRGAVGRLGELSESFRRHLITLESLRYIRRVTNGYKVSMQRPGQRFDKAVSGFSPQSLQKAMRIRDEALARLPPKHVYPVREEVWRALGLSSPIGGITHFPKRSLYRVDYEEEGKGRLKVFYYRHVAEADAYAAAVKFAEELFTAAQGGRKVSAPFIKERDGRMTAALKELLTAGDLDEGTAK